MSTAPARYTDEQTLEMVKAYVAAPTAETVKTFAEKFGRSVQSVVAKLVRENVYVKAAKKETAEKVQRKEELVWAMELAVGKELPSMFHMTIKDIEKLMEFMRVEGNTTK